LHTWVFAAHNTQALLEVLSEEDTKLFDFDVKRVNWEVWCVLFCEGIKKYIFKEIESETVGKMGSKL